MYVVELAMLLRLESLSACAEIFGLLGEFILTKNKEYLFSYLPQLRNLAAQAVLRCSHKSRSVNNGGWCSTLLANEWRCCRQITWRCQRRWTCSEARCAYRPFRFDQEKHPFRVRCERRAVPRERYKRTCVCCSKHMTVTPETLPLHKDGLNECY